MRALAHRQRYPHRQHHSTSTPGNSSRSVTAAAFATVAVILSAMVSVTDSINSCYLVTKYGLKTADCSRRSLSAIPQDLDLDIKVLFLCDNEGAMRHLTDDALHHYAGLQELHLTRDGIHSIAVGAFRHTRNLQLLDLEGNALTTVPTPAFEWLSSLRFLSLRGNPLGRLPASAFHPLANLEVLHVDYCQLEHVDPRALHHLDQLIQLNIANNDLRTLNVETRYHLSESLTVLRAHNNPWYCDCGLRWLRLWLERAKINWNFASSEGTPTCHSPAIISNIPWTHLQPNQFACPSRIEIGGDGRGNGTSGHTELRAGTGGNVTFHCHVYGDPRPSIQWVKGSQLVQTTNGHNARVVNVNATNIHTRESYIRSTLFLYSARVENIGDYRCVAENSAGRSEVMFKLIVEGHRERSDEVIPAQTKTVSERGTDLAAAELGWHVLVGVAAGAGTVILVLATVIVIMARRRCTSGSGGSTARQLPSKSKQRPDGNARTATLLTHNTSGEFSMRAIKAYGSTSHSAMDDAAATLLSSSNAASINEQMPLSSTTADSAACVEANVVRPSDRRNNENRQDERVNNTQIFTSPKHDRLKSSDANSQKPNTPIANGSPGKSPAKLVMRSTNSSPQKLPTSPPQTNTSATDARQRDHNTPSPAKTVSIACDTSRARAQTVPRHLPPRIPLCDGSSAAQAKDTYRTLRPADEMSQKTERAPCQNPVCLKAHLRERNGQPTRLSHVGNSATLGRTSKQGNGSLTKNRSRSVGHLGSLPTNSSVDTADTCTGNHSPHLAAASMFAADVKQYDIAANNTIEMKQHSKAVSPNATRKDIGIGHVQSTSPKSLTVTASPGVTSSTIVQGSPQRHYTANSYISINATPSTLNTVRNLPPQQVNFQTTSRQSPVHSKAKVARITTIGAHDAAMQHHLHNSSVIAYPCPGERDEYGTAV